MTTISSPPTEALLEALLGSPLAVAVIDRDLRYTAASAALAHLIERDPPAIIGVTMREATPPLADQPEPTLQSVLETGQAVHDLEVHGTDRNAGRVSSEHR